MLKALPSRTGQCGLLALSNGYALGFDVLSRPDVYTALHQRLLRSYMLERPADPDNDAPFDPSAAASEFLRSVKTVQEHRFKSIGLGRDYRYAGAECVGSALVHSGHVAHVAFFHEPPERLNG